MPVGAVDKGRRHCVVFPFLFKKEKRKKEKDNMPGGTYPTASSGTVFKKNIFS
jgi:hypothetical protein